ncbi:hypothetical protein E3C22_00590 [Jiella endophytica]|uniref:Ribbon-helix-helix protein, CopG family n=1 Tax=Jiella endophytica TaxID=2558362 RepID=A0A4Y8RG77_9HYPH|nr:hypothetical protein [Jiella endophytica]TFF20713.1 hypothetical protein E3C22_17630 [Jiella endophytica]TFF27014.1 hypothetical protein E3C22_00590 [Jiella endophytica]
MVTDTAFFMKMTAWTEPDMAEPLQVTLPEDLMQEIAAEVESGAVPTPDELIRQALATYFEMDRAARIEAVRARVDAARRDPRPSVPVKEAFERVRREVSRRHRSS